MPQYYFHLRSPDLFIIDDEGMELRDLEHAKTEAERGARDLMAADLRAGRPVDHQRFEICNGDSELLLVIVFRDLVQLPIH